MWHYKPALRPGGVITGVVFALAVWATGAQAQKASADDCTMTAETVWLQEFPVTASTDGECGLGDLSLVVRNGTDEVIWSASYRPEDLFGFQEVYTTEAMAEALSDWISANVSQSSTGTLPQWSEGAEGPEYREFPFYPAEDAGRDFYEMTRDLDLSMVCYVQGHESTLCLFRMPDGQVLEPIGYQSFPG